MAEAELEAVDVDVDVDGGVTVEEADLASKQSVNDFTWAASSSTFCCIAQNPH